MDASDGSGRIECDGQKLLTARLLFSFFKRLVDPYPYPNSQATTAPARSLPFMLASTAGLQRRIAAMATFTAAIAAFEALLFALAGTTPPPRRGWRRPA